MAVIVPTFARVGNDTVKFTYALMLNGDTGTPISTQFADYSDRTIQATGTMGVGGSLTMQGSNNGTTFGQVNNAQGTAVAITTVNNISQLLESALYMQPKVTAGDGTTSITAIVTLRRPRSALET